MEPGSIRTRLTSNRREVAERLPAYEARRRRALAALSALESKGPDAIKVAETVLAIVESDSPRLRYTVGTDARVVPRLRQWLPESVFERGLAKTFALDDED